MSPPVAGLGLPPIPPPSREAEAAARRRQAALLKPPGSLGRLEDLAILIAGLRAVPIPPRERKLAVVFAADHGVARVGVSAYPSDVTAQMLRSFALGEAAVNALARASGADLLVVDVGTASETSAPLGVLDRRIRSGTASLLDGSAMARGEAEVAVAAGAAVVEARLDDGIDLLALGEIGIGNTTAAAAVTAALLGVTAEATVGPGTGIDDAALAGKRRVVAAALQRHRPDPTDPIAVLAAVGGLELAALAGAMLRAAAARVPVLLDGFPTGAAALVAAALDPAVVPYLIASHRSPEPGHRLVLEWLGKEPLLELGMRLGEASGALLGLQVVDAALAVHAEMATFAEAGVAGPVQTPPNGPSASSDAADGGLEAGAGAATPPSAVPNLRRDSLLATLTSSVSSSRDQSDPERHRPSPGHVDRGA